MFFLEDLGRLFTLSFEAILKVIRQVGALCNQGHDKTRAHLHQIHDVVVGHLRRHDGFDLCGFRTGFLVHNPRKLFGLHQWRQVAVVLGDHQNGCAHLFRQVVNRDAFQQALGGVVVAQAVQAAFFTRDRAVEQL